MFKNKHTIMGPSMRFDVLHDLFKHTLSETYYYPQLSTESRRRLDNDFSRLINAIIDIDDMELFSISKIFFGCILPLAKHAISIEERKLCESKKNQKDKCKDTTYDAKSQTEEKQKPEQKEKDGECHSSIEISKDIPEEALRILLGDALQRLEEIYNIIHK